MKNPPITTKQRQIEFIWHLRSQGFTAKEIANIYGVAPKRIETVIDAKFRNRLKQIA